MEEVQAGSTIGGIINSGKNFLQNGLESESPINTNALKSGSNLLYNILLILGIAVTLIWGLVLAIKFITGSLGEKADVKSHLIVYVVGCIIIFGAFAIWRALLNMLEPISQ